MTYDYENLKNDQKSTFGTLTFENIYGSYVGLDLFLLGTLLLHTSKQQLVIGSREAQAGKGCNAVLESSKASFANFAWSFAWPWSIWPE